MVTLLWSSHLWEHNAQPATSRADCAAMLTKNWMNEWCIYIALYCVLFYTQSALKSLGGSLLNHHQCAASTWMIRRLSQDYGASVLTTHQLQVERRESQSCGWGLLGGHDWQGPVVGIWPGHRCYTSTLYEKCHGIFNDHRESGPRFNVSSERWCFWQYSVPVTILGR